MPQSAKGDDLQNVIAPFYSLNANENNHECVFLTQNIIFF